MAKLLYISNITGNTLLFRYNQLEDLTSYQYKDNISKKLVINDKVAIYNQRMTTQYESKL